MIKLNKMKLANTKKGFTIVELLIVVVVIAILAVVTIVAYNGIQNKAKTSAAISTLASVSKKLETFRYTNGGASENYPSSLTQASISNNTYVVGYYPANANRYFCIDTTVGAFSYFQTSSDPIQRSGTCPTASGLTHWWPLNGDVTDYVTGTALATNYSATLAAGQNGKTNGSYSFANGSGSYIDTNIMENRDAFAFSIWVNPSVSGGYRTALSEARDCCGTGYKGFELKTSYTSDNSGVSVWNGGSGSAASVSGSNTVVNAWNFYAGTYDGSTLRFYKDGILVGSSSYTALIGSTINTLKIGRAGAVGAGYFIGLIDDVRIYNRALSDSEIANIYAIGAQ